MERDSGQGDLFPDADGEQAAQRATPKRRSKPPVHSPSSAIETPPKAERQRSPARDEINIVRFPVEVWAPRLWQGKVDKTSQLLNERKTERGRENLWRATVRTLFAQMHRRGATGEEVERQIDDFHAAVSLAMSKRQSGPGAA